MLAEVDVLCMASVSRFVKRYGMRALVFANWGARGKKGRLERKKRAVPKFANVIRLTRAAAERKRQSGFVFSGADTINFIKGDELERLLALVALPLLLTQSSQQPPPSPHNAEALSELRDGHVRGSRVVGLTQTAPDLSFSPFASQGTYLRAQKRATDRLIQCLRQEEERDEAGMEIIRGPGRGRREGRTEARAARARFSDRHVSVHTSRWHGLDDATARLPSRALSTLTPRRHS